MSKPDGESKVILLDNPDFTYQLKYDEQEQGYRTAFQLGDGALTEVEPWHLEAIMVAIAKLQEYQAKLERHVLKKFVGQAMAMRDAKRRMLQEVGETSGQPN